MNIKRRLKRSVPVLIACAAALIFAAAVPSCGRAPDDRSPQRETEATFCVRAGGIPWKPACEYGTEAKSAVPETWVVQMPAGTNRLRKPGLQYAGQPFKLSEELKTTD